MLSHWIQWKAKLLLLLTCLVILLHLIFWSSCTFNTYQLSMNLFYRNYQLSVFVFIVVNAKNVTICRVLASYMLFPSENVACRALEGILTWTTLKCTTLCWSPQNLIFTIREGERRSFSNFRSPIHHFSMESKPLSNPPSVIFWCPQFLIESAFEVSPASWLPEYAS